MQVWIVLEQLGKDLRYSLRLARRESGFTAIAVLTLALGIGMNTAVFSVVNTVLLRKPPYADPSRLAILYQRLPKLGSTRLGMSPPEYADYRERTRAFASIAGFEDWECDLTGGTEPVHIQTQRVSGTLFSTLGITPLVGRTFLPAEESADGAKVLVLSYQLWQKRFGGRTMAVGNTVRLNEEPYTVVGIMPRGFEFPLTAASVGEPPDAWVPLTFNAKRMQRRAAEFPVHIVARLRDGISLAAAEQDARRVAEEFQREHPGTYGGAVHLQVNLETLGASDVARTRPVLLSLAGAVIFVLLIACANVMNLLLTRSAGRKREMAVRNALGASAARLVTQVLTEGLLFAVLGAGFGTVIAQTIIKLVVTLWPSFLTGLATVQTDPAVLVFTMALSIVSVLVCSVVPALSWTNQKINSGLRQSGSTVSSSETTRMRHALVAFEASSAVVLLIGAGLLIHSLIEVLRVPVGFSPSGVLVARTSLNRQRYPSGDRRRSVERQIVNLLTAVPGVSIVGLATHIPLADDRQIGFVLEGADARSVRWADNALVSGEYFGAMGIPLVRGRTFTDQDTPESVRVAIINDSMARRLWGNTDVLGKRIIWGGQKLTIVGVVGDVHIKALESEVNDTIYNSVYQVESGATTSAVFILRTQAATSAAAAPAVRRAIWSVDKGLPVFDIEPMDRIVSRSLTDRSFLTVLLACFALLALALAVVGLYGVLSYSVAQRAGELGVRIALGASPHDILRLVLGGGLRLTAVGIMIGILLGVIAGRAMSHLLFGVRVLDPIAIGVAVSILLGVAVIACYVPARRASRLDPVVTLRGE